MAETLTARFLDRSTIDKAYPFVRNVVPGMTAARWMRFVRLHLVARSPHRPRGVMTIQNAAGCILSLFAFEVRADLIESRILCIDHIMVPNLPGRGATWPRQSGLPKGWRRSTAVVPFGSSSEMVRNTRREISQYRSAVWDILGRVSAR